MRPEQEPLLRGVRPCQLLDLPIDINDEPRNDRVILHCVDEVALCGVVDELEVVVVTACHLWHKAENITIPWATGPVRYVILPLDEVLCCAVRVQLQRKQAGGRVGGVLPWNEPLTDPCGLVQPKLAPWKPCVCGMIYASPVNY